MSKRGDARRAARSLDALFGADKLGQSKPPRVGRDRWADAPRQAERKAESKKSKKREEQRKQAKADKAKADKAGKKGKGGGKRRGLF